MNFFKDRELANRFKNGRVSSQERLYYFLLFAFFSSTFFQMILNRLSEPSKKNFYVEAFFLILMFMSVIIPYQTNRKGDDKEFIERYICLSLPIIVRVLIILVPLLSIFLIITDFVLKLSLIHLSMKECIIQAIILGYVTFRLNCSMRIAASGQPKEEPLFEKVFATAPAVSD